MKSLLAILLSFLLAESPLSRFTAVIRSEAPAPWRGVTPACSFPRARRRKTGPPILSATTISGLFLMNVPDQGLATGTVAIFSSGIDFSRHLQALPDPSNSAGIRGVINASFTNNGYTYTDQNWSSGHRVDRASHGCRRVQCQRRQQRRRVHEYFHGHGADWNSECRGGIESGRIFLFRQRRCRK